jgi:DNA-binding NtrC family response regulator
MIDSLRVAEKARPARILLIDDDPVFCRRLSTLAKQAGIPVETCDSIEQLGNVSSLANFDVAVLDYFLEDTTGMELAEYMDTFFESGVDVVMISGRTVDEVREDSNKKAWPRCVKAFVNKDDGVEAILDAVLESLSKQGKSAALAWH